MPTDPSAMINSKKGDAGRQGQDTLNVLPHRAPVPLPPSSPETRSALVCLLRDVLMDRVQVGPEALVVIDQAEATTVEEVGANALAIACKGVEVARLDIGSGELWLCIAEQAASALVAKDWGRPASPSLGTRIGAATVLIDPPTSPRDVLVTAQLVEVAIRQALE